MNKLENLNDGCGCGVSPNNGKSTTVVGLTLGSVQLPIVA
jgi:hypothetical protein